MSYTITNTRGTTVATVPSTTIDTIHCPLTLIGAGYSSFGTALNDDLYALLENFANSTTPANPVEGMISFSTTQSELAFYDGVEWIPLASATNSAMTLLPMATDAASIDFTDAATTVIYTNTNGYNVFPTALMLIPVGSVSTTTPPVFNLFVDSPEDVMNTTIVNGAATGVHAFYTIEGSAKFLTDSSDSVSLQITTGAGGSSLNYQVLLFGMIQT